MSRLDKAAELIGEVTENPQAKRLLEETINYVGDILKGRIKTGPLDAESIVNGLRKSGISVNRQTEDLFAFNATGENGQQMQGLVPKGGGFLEIGSIRHPEVTTDVRGASVWSDSRGIGTSFDFTSAQDSAVTRLGDLGLRIRLVAPKAPTVSFAERNKLVYEPAVNSEFDWVPIITNRSFRGQEMRTSTSIQRPNGRLPGMDVAVSDSITLHGTHAWLAGKNSRITIKGLADSEDFDNYRTIRTKL
jgi:hypothetical protein